MSQKLLTSLNPLFSHEAESGVIGSCLLDRTQIPRVQDILLDESYFHKIENRLLYKLLCELDNRRMKEWDLIVLRDFLQSKHHLEAVGGMDYIYRILENVPSAVNAGYYAQIVYEKHLRRQISDLGDKIKGEAVMQETLDGLIQTCRNDFNELTSGESKSSSMMMLEESFEGLKLNIYDDYIQTQIPPLDDKITGFGKGNLIIVAGRPSMGKSTLILTLIKTIVCQNISVLLYTLEMSRADWMLKMLYSETDGIPLSVCYRPYLTDDQTMQLEHRRDVIKKWPLMIDESRYLTPQKLRNHLHCLIESKGIQAVFIDYLQLLKPNHRYNSRYEEISALSGELKTLAMDYNIPLIAACQLNRAVEMRADKTPHMSDLRDSGALEQDADLILLVHRPPYYWTEAEKLAGDIRKAEIIVAKNRRGKTGVIESRFFGEFSRFELISK